MSSITLPEPQALSVDQAAVALGIARGTAYRAVHRGELPSVRIGGRLLIPRAALERLLRGEEASPSPASVDAPASRELAAVRQ